MSRFFCLPDLEAYTPGEQPKEGQYIKLNTNENPFPPSPVMESLLLEKSRHLQRYNDNTCKELTEVFAQYRGVGKENVIFSNGSDEILAFCFLAFCDRSRGICFPEISYGFYQVFAQLFSVEGEKIPLAEDLSVNPRDYYHKDKCILIANPNAPTGICLSLEEVRGIVEHNPSQVVIMDEAYIDFGGESASQLCKEYDNLLVVGTFSKSRNLAGARLGYAIGCESLISDLNTIKYSFNPYNVNSLTQLLGTVSIQEEAYFQECRQKIMETRETFVAGLEDLGFHTLPSSANFVFTEHPKHQGEALFAQLKERGILVRHFPKDKISSYLRITIGTGEEMRIVLKNLKEMVDS